jgi:peptide/nickel transport system ATP-binding protein
MTAISLELDRIRLSYTGVPVIDGLSLTVRAGEILVLTGPSGCGKSTVLRALAGLVSPSAGVLRVAGEAVGRRRSKAQRRALQFVFQDPYGSLHPRHTVDRALREPLEIHGLPEPDRRIVEAMAGVDLAPALRFRYPHQLSGGQRQRVAIARALIPSPRILLLDEPTSALDVSVQAEVLNLLDDIRSARGLTSILVSHDLAVVAHMCERVAVMKDGALVEILPTADLRRGDARDPYTRALVAASRGYRRSVEGVLA